MQNKKLEEGLDMILEGEKDLSEVLWPDQKINKKNTGTCSKSRNVRSFRV